MAKRFIDTEIFNDEWFMNLSTSAKLLWIYFITNCNHAGILEVNKKLIEFQTGLKSYDTVSKELSKSYLTVKETKIFIPKFLKFQYPDFPKSKVRQQEGAIKILKEYGLWDDNLNSLITVNKDLSKSYVSDSVNGNDKGGMGENLKEPIEILTPFQKYIKEKLPNVASLKKQITKEQVKELVSKFKTESIESVLLSMENKKDLLKKYSSVYLTASNWLSRDENNFLSKKETPEERAKRLSDIDRGVIA